MNEDNIFAKGNEFSRANMRRVSSTSDSRDEQPYVGSPAEHTSPDVEGPPALVAASVAPVGSDDEDEVDEEMAGHRNARLVFGCLKLPDGREVVEFKRPGAASDTPSKDIYLTIGLGKPGIKDSIASICAKSSDPSLKEYSDPNTFDVKVVTLGTANISKSGKSKFGVRNIIAPLPGSFKIVASSHEES